jgi:hypothetical protein
MKAKLIIMTLLIAQLFATHLVDFQNVTLGTGLSTTPVYAVNTGNSANNLVAAVSNVLAFLAGSVGDFAGQYNVTMPETILEARFRDDETWVAARGNTTNNIYFLKPTPTNYVINQTLSVGSTPTALCFANFG